MPAVWRNVTLPEAAPKIASDLAGLGAGSYDAQPATVRIGVYPDQRTERFLWSADAGKWVGEREYVVLSALDAWAMDWSRQPLATVRNKWSRPNGGVSWQIVGPRAQISADVTLPQAVIPILGPTFALNFDPAAQFLLRDSLITYTGYTNNGNGTGSFTGCTNHSSNNGKTYPGSHTPVIPYATINGGDQGGWGTATVILDRVGDMYAAGFTLEERLDGFFNGTTDLTAVEFATFYLNTNLGEDLGIGTNYPDLTKTADQVPNLLGPGVTLTGPADDMGGYTLPGNHFAYYERGFQRRTSAWTPWSAAAPTKRFLSAILYGRHTAAAKNTGEAYSLNAMLRWTGDPA